MLLRTCEVLLLTAAHGNAIEGSTVTAAVQLGGVLLSTRGVSVAGATNTLDLRR